MIKKTIIFKNVFDKEVTKDLYFGLTKAEYLELEALWHDEGGIEGQLELVQRGDNPKLIIETFKTIVGKAYGERRNDEFLKNEDVKNQFLASDAYSEVLFGLIQGDIDPGEFIRGILPSGGKSDGTPKTQSELARERSQANMQGFKKKQTPNKSFQETPELPPAEPELEDDPAWAEANTDDAPKLPEGVTFEEWLEYKRATS